MDEDEWEKRHEHAHLVKNNIIISNVVNTSSSPTSTNDKELAHNNTATQVSDDPRPPSAPYVTSLATPLNAHTTSTAPYVTPLPVPLNVNSTHNVPEATLTHLLPQHNVPEATLTPSPPQHNVPEATLSPSAFGDTDMQLTTKLNYDDLTSTLVNPPLLNVHHEPSPTTVFNNTAPPQQAPQVSRFDSQTVINSNVCTPVSNEKSHTEIRRSARLMSKSGPLTTNDKTQQAAKIRSLEVAPEPKSTKDAPNDGVLGSIIIADVTYGRDDIDILATAAGFRYSPNFASLIGDRVASEAETRR